MGGKGRSGKLKILVGTPTIHPDSRFLAALPSFLFEASKKYDITHKFVYRKPIYEADNEIMQDAVDGGYDYFLILEDDHWGFTVEMLDSLIGYGHPVCAIPYHSRHYPYFLTAMHFYRNGEGLLKDYSFFNENKETSGFHRVDLVGFGFTLFEVDVVRYLSKPWFYPTKYEKRATDKFFCKKLQDELGISPVANMDYVLPHRDITSDNVFETRKNSFMAKNGIQAQLRHKKQTTNFDLVKFLKEREANVLGLATEV